MRTGRLGRSYLFVPGSNERLLGKALLAGADAVVLDLEDAVAPQQKQQARQMVALALERGNSTEGLLIYVRVNSISSGLWREDVATVVSPALHGIRLAKAESADEIADLDAALVRAERAAGLAVGSIRIVPTVETARGVLAAAEMSLAPRVEMFAFGAADFLRDIGAEADPTGLQALYAQSHLVLVSRAADLRPPIAPVYTQVADLDGLRATSEAARRLGFFGRSAIHPSQIAVIHNVFSPTPAQVVEAQMIVEAFERAGAEGSSAFLMGNGQFVDRAVAERARDIIELAALLSAPRNGNCS